MQLTPQQESFINRAKEALATPLRGHETADLAYRVGQLEWLLGEVIHLTEGNDQ